MMNRERLNRFKITYWLLVIGGFFIWPIFSFGAATSNVVVNELMWMGSSASSRDEWIELRNMTSQDINLSGWTIEGAARSGGALTIPEDSIEHILPANSFYLISYYSKADNLEEPETILNVITDWRVKGMGNISLANSDNGNLILKDSGRVTIDIVKGDSWPAGEYNRSEGIYYSMERNNVPGDGTLEENWHTCSHAVNLIEGTNECGTPREQNSSNEEASLGDGETEEPSGEEPEVEGWIPATVANQPPIADAGPDITALVNQEISFDGFLSYDSDDDTLTYFWNFGDGATETEEKASHIYPFAGQYIVTLLVDDGELSDLDIITVNIYNQSVIISEFIPNPTGSDTENEWIELFNQSDQIANLTNWQLDDQEDGSSPFVFPANSLIAPRQFLVLRRPITKISLNNDTDQVRLIYPDGSLATEVSYTGENEQGFSVAFDGLDYFWTKIPTPGSANIISSVGLEGQEQNISSNNPQPIIEQTQEAPEILAKINLSQSQEFSTLNPSQDSEVGSLTPTGSETPDYSQSDQSVEEIAEGLIESQSQQAASLAQTSQSSQKANLILTLSIIISGSLLVSWFLIRLKKRIIK